MKRIWIIASVVAFASFARASHSHDGWLQLHVSTMHDNNGTATTPGTLDEEYCVQSHTAAVTTTAIGGFIEDVLTKRPGKQ